MEVIIDAKERQAAEANKNATSLLLEIDQEKVFLIHACVCVTWRLVGEYGLFGYCRPSPL